MQKRFYVLEVATRTRRPFSGRGCHALTWRSHDHSLAAYLSRHLRQTVLLPGNSTVACTYRSDQLPFEWYQYSGRGTTTSP